MSNHQISRRVRCQHFSDLLRVENMLYIHLGTETIRLHPIPMSNYTSFHTLNNRKNFSPFHARATILFRFSWFHNRLSISALYMPWHSRPLIWSAKPPPSPIFSGILSDFCCSLSPEWPNSRIVLVKTPKWHLSPRRLLHQMAPWPSQPP